MLNFKLQKLKFLPLLILVLVFIVNYFKVPFIFFQQDEWYGFGNLILYGPNLIFHRFEQNDINHLVPINHLVNYIFFEYFPLNHIAYNIFGLLIHFLNAILIYKIGQKLLGNDKLALISALFFVTLSSASELVMWPTISTNALALTFSLGSLKFILEFQKNKNIFLHSLFSAVLIIVSILMIEYAAGMLVFMPLGLLILSEGKNIKKVILYIIPLVSLSFIYMLIRFAPQIMQANLPTKNGSSNLLLEKVFTFPISYVGQIFITEPVINFVGLFTNPQPIFATERMVYFINLGAGALIISGIILFITKLWKKEKQIAKNLIFSLTFLISSALPFVSTPGSIGVNSSSLLIPSRYFYFGIVGISLLLASVLQISLKSRNLIKAGVIGFLLIYILIGLGGNWYKATLLYERGKVREVILTTIKADHPDLPNKTIFYTESDRTYYGLSPSERILPFQSGVGQTLLVWYQPMEGFPKSFFQDRFLWGIADQGYKEFNGRGFGYFQDFALLAETVEKNKVRPESVFAFRYRSDTNTLEDMTGEVRGRLVGFLADKREVDPRLFVATPSINPGDTGLIFDRKRETFWNSEVPYATSQTIDIDLQDSRKIAQVRIDSYNNKDQNEVGYEVSTSRDGKDWKTGFYAKRYPPGDDGYVDLFFEPQMARFVRIQQIGFHQFARWVIHELRVYEAIN